MRWGETYFLCLSHQISLAYTYILTPYYTCQWSLYTRQIFNLLTSSYLPVPNREIKICDMSHGVAGRGAVNSSVDLVLPLAVLWGSWVYIETPALPTIQLSSTCDYSLTRLTISMSLHNPLVKCISSAKAASFGDLLNKDIIAKSILCVCGVLNKSIH